jgi:hypothetical protein
VTGHGADVVALSDERDLWQRRLLEAQRAAYRAGYADGRADAQRDADRAWAARPPLIVRDDLTCEEIEARRWELRGEQRTRETFGRPHPADFTGRTREAAA